MKSLHRILLGALLLTVGIYWTAAAPHPQDMVTVAPNNTKVLLDNDRVRVLDFHGGPGDKIGMHSHPDYVTYLISGNGKSTFTAPDGKTTTTEQHPGQAAWHNAETHSSTSSAPTHAILIELKK